MAKSWIQMRDPSGGEIDGDFDYENPGAFGWELGTIVHHLSMLNRYTGAAKRTYSVAEHCFRVGLYAADLAKVYAAGIVDPKQVARNGTAHDFVESVIGDVNSPLKRMPFMAGFRHFEEETLQPLVKKRFALADIPAVTFNGRSYDLVRCADLAALDFERAQLLGKPPHAWQPFDILPVVASDAFKGELGMPAAEARELLHNACAVLGLE